MIGLVIVASVIATLQYAYRIADHYTAVWGTVVGFARVHEAERSYRRAGHTGRIDFTTMQVLMPGVKVYSATSAHRNGVGRPYELQTIGGEQVLTTLVENESQASQIVEKLPGKAAYAAEVGGFRISYRPARVDTLTELIQRHSMHVSGPHGTHLKDRLNFGPGAIVTVGDPCLPPDGIHSGGISIESSGRPVTCVRIAPGTSITDREWRLVAGSSPPNPPPPRENCGDGTSVTDRATECQDCPDGSNIPIAATCPIPAVFERCGDGTIVVDASTECKDCWDGSNIPFADSCPTQASCGDGTLVIDRATECKNCPDGSNVTISASCPVACACGGFAPSAADCPSVSLKSCPSGCPSVCPFDTCATPTRSGPNSCSSGFSLVEIPGACTITVDCVANTCPCGATRKSDGTCPSVDKSELGATSCPSDYARVKVSETACTVTHECQQTCPCGGGSVTHPASCPTVTKTELGPTSCVSGYDRNKIAETECSVTYACQEDCACGNGTVTYPDLCPTVIKNELGPVSCPTDYVRTMGSSTECDITYACQRNCPCEGGLVTHPVTCPAIVKEEIGPASCPAGYTRTKIAETQCADTYACQKTCPCEGPIVTHPSDCPPIVKTGLGETSCAAGCNLVRTAETQCTITQVCQKTCWNDEVKLCAEECPAKPVSCANGNDYPDCCCAEMTPIETEYADRIEWSCPAKPTIGVPLGVDPGPNWTIVTIEHECYYERALVCIGSVGACFGPGNYCANPIQVWYGGGSICTGPNQECGNGPTGYICDGEGGIGPGP